MVVETQKIQTPLVWPISAIVFRKCAGGWLLKSTDKCLVNANNDNKDPGPGQTKKKLANLSTNATKKKKKDQKEKRIEKKPANNNLFRRRREKSQTFF